MQYSEGVLYSYRRGLRSCLSLQGGKFEGQEREVSNGYGSHAFLFYVATTNSKQSILVGDRKTGKQNLTYQATMRIINFKFMFLVCLWMCVVACSEKDNDSFKEQLKQYLRKDLPVTTVSSDKYAAYFDFTGAMTACSDPATDSTFNGLCQKITGSSELFDIYKLGDAKITPLSGDVRPAAIFANLKSASSKTEYYAPIEETLKKITNEGRGAVLVTDFEEYTKDGKIYRQAYATPYFKKWLANGAQPTDVVAKLLKIAGIEK